MLSLADRFKRYFSIGILNTALHWCVFLLACYVFGISQASSNLVAFLLAVTFSFFMNARYTFRQSATMVRYAMYVIFMALLSYATGYIADRFNMWPLFTLTAFSAISLGAGFVYANYVVFQNRDEE